MTVFFVSTILWYFSLTVTCVSMAFCVVWAVVTRVKPWIVVGISAVVIGINLNVVLGFLALFAGLPRPVQGFLNDVIGPGCLVCIAHFLGFLARLEGSPLLRSSRPWTIGAAWTVAGLDFLLVFTDPSGLRTASAYGVFLVSFVLEIGAILILFRLKSKSQDSWEIRELKLFVRRLAWPVLASLPLVLFEIFPTLIQPSPFGYRFTVGITVCAVLSILFVLFFFRWVAFHVHGLTTPNQGGELSKEKMARLGLSDREQELVSCLAAGLSNTRIGERLFISPSTVKNHLYNIYQKTGVKNRVEILNLLRNG